jgi:hypothetical protein
MNMNPHAQPFMPLVSAIHVPSPSLHFSPRGYDVTFQDVTTQCKTPPLNIPKSQATRWSPKPYQAGDTAASGTAEVAAVFPRFQQLEVDQPGAAPLHGQKSLDMQFDDVFDRSDVASKVTNQVEILDFAY